MSWNWSKAAAASKEVRSGITEIQLAYIMGILCDAGLDTTGQFLEIFVMAAVSHPDAVARAHEELDHVVGRDRLPNADDKPRLPFIDAMIEETMRWRPLTMAGVPHSNIDEDTYEGYRIPKGSVVIPATWTLCMSEVTYGSDSAEFRPERWPENPKLPNTLFGFGRRACTGERVARKSLFHAGLPPAVGV